MEHSDRTRRYGRRLRPFPNPYTSEEALIRERCPEGQGRLIIESRTGSGGVRRREIMARVNYTCQWSGCGAKVTLGTGGHVDRIPSPVCLRLEAGCRQAGEHVDAVTNGT